MTVQKSGLDSVPASGTTALPGLQADPVAPGHRVAPDTLQVPAAEASWTHRIRTRLGSNVNNTHVIFPHLRIFSQGFSDFFQNAARILAIFSRLVLSCFAYWALGRLQNTSSLWSFGKRVTKRPKPSAASSQSHTQAPLC